MGGKDCALRPTLLWLALAPLLGLFVLVPLALVPCETASAQVSPDEFPLTDLLEILFVDRNLMAVNASGGGTLTLRLRLGEKLLWRGSQGRIGMAFTNQRILAVAVGSAAWQREERFLEEVLPDAAFLGDRVALAITSQRLLGFTSAGNLIERSLGLRERVLVPRVGENVAVVVTDRRALGMSPQAGGFSEIRIQLEERIEAVEAASNLVTVTTNRRVLIFRGPTGSWGERRRQLR